MSTPQVLAWTAQAHRLDRARFPLLVEYIACRGRWPTFTTRWGSAAALRSGHGWAARLWASGQELRAVTVMLPPATAQGLERLPPGKVLAVVGAIVTQSPFTPRSGAVRAEWAMRAGWHFEAIVSAQDAARLEEMPSYMASSVNVRRMSDLEMFERQVRYMNKGHRRRASLEERAAHAEKMLSILAALGRDRLPPTLYIFGAAN